MGIVKLLAAANLLESALEPLLLMIRPGNGTQVRKNSTSAGFIFRFTEQNLSRSSLSFWMCCSAEKKKLVESSKQGTVVFQKEPTGTCFIMRSNVFGLPTRQSWNHHSGLFDRPQMRANRGEVFTCLSHFELVESPRHVHCRNVLILFEDFKGFLSGRKGPTGLEGLFMQLTVVVY